MFARILTYLFIGGLLIAAVAVSAPQYLTYLWMAFGVLFVLGLGYLALVYLRRVIMMLKNMKHE